MDHEFWQERWTSGQIAFHQPQPNETLKTLWPTLNLDRNAKVFVPLCGKSLDILWLREQGHRIMGVELSQLAVDAFFEENSLERTTEQRGQFHISRSEGIEIWCGDFFALPPDRIGDTNVVFDRGALVALPPDLRACYAERLTELLRPSTQILLLAVEYDQQEMGGPPFAVTKQMVTDYYQTSFIIEQVVNEPLQEIPERFVERGLTAMTHTAYVLKRNAQ